MSCPSMSTPCLWVLSAIVLLSAGCRSQVTSVYGESENYAAKCSPGGLTVLRAMAEEQGHRTYTVRSLSPANMQRLNTLIWCPDSFPNHNPATFAWIEKWLSQGDKTLVYIGRDFSPHWAYWSDIAKQYGKSPATRAQWLVALDEAAAAKNTLDTKRRAAYSTSATPWCLWNSAGGAMRSVKELHGPWREGIQANDTSIAIRSSPSPLKASELTRLKDELESIQAQRAIKPNKKNTPPPPFIASPDDWESQQIQLASGMSLENLPDLQPLLSDSEANLLIGVVDHNPVSRSKIFLVNNNSLFCNYSMLRAAHRQLASKMIAEFSPGGVGLVAGAFDPKVRSDNQDERQQGFEMLTVWPLNVVAIHAAFLGIATMIVFFPIFGRPKRLRRKSTADFGLHIDAIGALMQKSGDKEYATAQIAEYFRNVKGDSTSPWSNMSSNGPEPQSPFRSSQAE
jgi:hypothetical protein